MYPVLGKVCIIRHQTRGKRYKRIQKLILEIFRTMKSYREPCSSVLRRPGVNDPATMAGDRFPWREALFFGEGRNVFSVFFGANNGFYVLLY